MYVRACVHARDSVGECMCLSTYVRTRGCECVCVHGRECVCACMGVSACVSACV